jgi:hypothetical protein
MRANYTPVALKNAGVELEEILPQVLSSKPILNHYVHISRLYRRVAIGILLTSGDPKDFYAYLFNSSRAFAHFLQQVTNDEKVTSKADAFFDAVACRDEQGAAIIARESRHTLNAGNEYEEDFLYMSLLMRRFYLGAGEGEVRPMLDEWQQYANENPDLRLDVCRAIVDHDQDGFDQALEEAIQEKIDQLAEKRGADQLHPDEAATICHISTEVLSWVELAERVGLSVQANYRLAPSSARQFHRIAFPPPDDWQHPDGFSSLS